jgi:hypothetical protein
MAGMSRRRRERTRPPDWYEVTFVCTGFGSHPRRVLVLWTVSLGVEGAVSPLSWRGTDETRPIRTGATRTPTRPVNCRTCQAFRDYPEERARELAREAIGDGTRRPADIDICYRP